MPLPPIVVLDACVLYPAALRDLLMRLAAHGLILAKWSERIHEEWMTAVLRERPDIRRYQLERTRQLMDKHAGDCLVTGYERHLPGLSLPDPNDVHVLAAAIEGEAEAIVTWNLKDFPAAELEPHGVALWTPDEMLVALYTEDPELIIRMLAEHRACLKSPPVSASEYLETLQIQKLTHFAHLIGNRIKDL